jgi:hypothetical protein
MKKGQVDIERVCRNLNPEQVEPHVMNYVYSDHGARFLWAFVKLVAHRLRRSLKCHVDSLDLFEWSYASELPKVSAVEHAKRLAPMNLSEIDEITSEETSALSNTLLDTIEKK